MIESAQILMRSVEELNGLSLGLLDVEKRLSQIEIDYRIHVEDFKVALLGEFTEKGERMPAEDVRDAMAHKAFDRESYRNYLRLRAARDRAKGRIKDLHEIVAAHRSIVSAEKLELEASEGPQPAWSGQ